MSDIFLAFILIFSLVRADPCPDGYSQAPGGGDCYKLRVYFDYMSGLYYPAQTYSSAELDCNNDGGGMLASFHSQEENDFIQTLLSAEKHCSHSPDTAFSNIGLRCVGSKCRWDDGSPVTYTNFDGPGPANDGKTRCYGLAHYAWSPKNCTATYQSDCWLCSVKAVTMQCLAGETAYKGGCISVHTTPLDQKSAEASCPGGGHLISIHGNSEEGLYMSVAEDAGIKGTMYIGGTFSENNNFEWTDGSYYNMNSWANGFPNKLFGSCAVLLTTDPWGRWTNADCADKQPYICFRNGGVYGPTASPPPAQADAQCPPIQYYTTSGSIVSPNYPVSIPSQQSCVYILETKEGTQASVHFPAYNCRSGTSLSLYDDIDGDQPFITFTSPPPPSDRWYTATTNTMKIIFSANGTSTPLGTGWEAEFTGKRI